MHLHNLMFAVNLLEWDICQLSGHGVALVVKESKERDKEISHSTVSLHMNKSISCPLLWDHTSIFLT